MVSSVGWLRLGRGRKRNYAGFMERRLTRRDWYYIIGLTIAAALLRFINLTHPGQIIFDETYFANFAHDYLTHTKFFDAEPPLAKFLIAGGEKLFGFNSFGWRFMPALFGTALIPLFYVLAKRLFGGWRIPLFAALLALADGLLLVESRTAVIDIFVVFFNLLTYLCFLLHLQSRTVKARYGWLVATGVALGLGLAVKWIALACIVPIAAVLLVLALSKRRWVQKLFRLKSPKEVYAAFGATVTRLSNPFLYLLLLGVLPFTLYVWIFSYHVPFDSTGEGIWGIHKQIFNYHHHLKATHPYGSMWFTWPFDIRPVAYYFQSGAQWQGIVALGNPVVWWSGVVAVAFAISQFFKRRSVAVGFILLALAAHYGPWSLIGRVLFIYHYLGGLPFVIFSLAFALNHWWEERPREGTDVFIWSVVTCAAAVLGGLLWRSWWPSEAPVLGFINGAALAVLPPLYLAFSQKKRPVHAKHIAAFGWVVLLSFVFFYPVWTGLSLLPDDYYRHMWLKSWI